MEKTAPEGRLFSLAARFSPRSVRACILYRVSASESALAATPHILSTPQKH